MTEILRTASLYRLYELLQHQETKQQRQLLYIVQIFVVLYLVMQYEDN